jgi:hypothetical protein
MKEWLKKRNKYTHENLLRDLRVSEPSVYQNFLRLDATSMFRKLEGVVGTGWSWFRIGTGGGHL